LTERPRADYSPAAGCQVCQTIVQAAEQQVPVIAKGELAEKLEALQPKTPVVVEGDLVVHQWDVDGKQVTRLVLMASSVETS